jgi:AraC-like DNA-binding protein
MAEMTMFLTNMALAASLESWVSRLPQATHQVLGRRTGVITLPDNIVCFQRCVASELNRPRRGRALHHRCVLIIALKTAVTICVDDRTIRIKPGEGMLVLPFQFHHYIEPEAENLCWFFVTFDLADVERLETLRFRPLKLTSQVKALATDLVSSYLREGSESDLPSLLLALLLARLCRQDPLPQQVHATTIAPGMVMQVNQLVHRNAHPLGIKEIAAALGISQSHLRARFRASCGVSLGKHLRRLRLEKACGLLRLTPSRVSEVAELCGFNSIYHFSRAFHAAYGVSPMAYRHGQEVNESAAPRRRQTAKAV